MKKILGKTIGSGIVIITALAFLGLTPKADALTISSEEILMIDGTGDGDSTVTILAFDLLRDFEFGYKTGVSFTKISSGAGVASFEGDTLVDFAIRNTASGDITAASDGAATMDFWGNISAENSEHPEVEFDYWQGVNIWWTPTSFPDDILITLSCNTDGIAPVSYTGYSVPDAAIMFLLGPALLVLGVIGRRKTKK